MTRTTDPLLTIGDDLTLPCTVQVLHNDDGYFDRVRELPGCMTWMERADDLGSLIEDAKRAWIEVALEYLDDVPVPAARTRGKATRHTVLGNGARR